MLLLHLFDGANPPSKIGNFHKFLLDRFQPLMPLAVSNLSLRIISATPSILGVQLLQLSNLGSKVGDLFPKHFQVVHTNQHNIRIGSQVITSVGRAKQL